MISQCVNVHCTLPHWRSLSEIHILMQRAPTLGRYLTRPEPGREMVRDSSKALNRKAQFSEGRGSLR